MFANLALSATLTILSASDVQPNLAEFEWQARPILVFASPDDARLQHQLDAFRAEAAALHDRDNVVIVDIESESALRRIFAPDGFTVILIGKDGGEKLRRNRVVAVDELNALIDQMPMRRREMRRGQGRADN